nr:phosphonate metabolism transcriptional regulator PhnF [Rhizobium laguerreae]
MKGITVSRTGTTLWHQVGEALEAEIETGMYPGGSRLPTEPDLAKRFNVSRNTVRRAMATLEEKGLVRIEQGRGTFVHERFLSFKISKRTRFSQNLRSQGLEPGHELLGSDIVPATEEIAAILHLRSNDAVIFMRSSMLAEGVVVSLNEVYYPFRRFPLLAEKRAQLHTMTEVLAEYGVSDYTRLSTAITARPPTDDEARLLRQPRSRWVICTQKIDVDQEGAPICCSNGVWAADLVKFLVDETDFAPAYASGNNES